VSFPSWGSLSKFNCDPWTFGDGSKDEDSFTIKTTGDILGIDGEFELLTYHLVSDSGGFLTFIHSGGYGLILFVHDGDFGLFPLESIHLNSKHA
jgi:hypothetical protein